MTTLTVKFSGIQEGILEKLVETGVAETKSEAIRMAVLHFGIETGVIKGRTIIEDIQKSLAAQPIGEKEIMDGIKRAKRARVSGQ